MRLFLKFQGSRIFVVGGLIILLLTFFVKPCQSRNGIEVPSERQNLINNGDIEILENGNPVGWSSSGILPQVKYSIGSPGFQSDHALTIPVGGFIAPNKWETQIKDVKSHSKYALSFWYRLPEKGVLELTLFGKHLPVTKMFQYNPMHWCRYSAIIDSGNYSGDCQVEIIGKNGVGPFKFWVDQVDLYEGEPPIGKNYARLDYQYYNKVFVSPDIISPIPFAFEWTFADEKRPAEIQYIVELPAGIELVDIALGRICKWPPDGWEITWTRPDYSSKIETEKIIIDQRPYIRVVARVKSVPGDIKQLSDYVVPVGVRDYWETSVGRYSGMTTMTLYVRTNTSSGSLPFYYYAKWAGGKQPRKKLAIEITPVQKVKPSDNLLLVSEVQIQAGEKNAKLGEDFIHFGLNGIGTGSLGLKNGERDLKTKLESFNSLGLKYFSTWINIPAFGSGDKEAKAMDINGKRTDQDKWCLSYRGPDWIDRMAQYKKNLENGINFFAFDDVSNSTCYCEKCIHSFSEFLKSNTDLPYVDPSKFMKEAWKGSKEYSILWQDFSLWHYGKTVRAMKEELLQYATSRGLKSKIYFGLSSWLPFTHPFAASTLSVFDFDIRQTYINWASSGFGGSPKLVGDYLYRTQKTLGEYALPLAPTLSPGLTYMHPACALDPHAQMKYQILESMMAPNFAGYIMYAGQDIDVGDMKYMAEANALMIRYEDIILKGKAMEPIEISKWSGVRIKMLKSRGLVLVSDYSTYEPKEKNVRFSSGELSGKTLLDVETGEELKPVAGTYEVKISAERARLFHFDNNGGVIVHHRDRSEQ